MSHERISKGIGWIVLLLGLVGVAAVCWSPAQAAGALCGDGSAPDYGFDYDLRQEHWTVDWQAYVSESTVNEVDGILDRLNWESVAQTMILFKPQAEVGNRVNCAVHFLRYMKLGLPSGERKDNGFVFLVVVEDGKIDVHYGVGLGLPALTAPELTELNRTAEETYRSSGSMDEALLALVRAYDRYARSKYPALVSPAPTAVTINLPALPEGPAGVATLCCLICIGILILIFVIWLLTRLARLGIHIRPGRWSPPGSGFPFGGGGGGGSPWRGGSGSGRSGRGN